MKLAEIAQKLDCKLEGDGTIEITGVAGIEDAQPGELTFLSNRRYRSAIAATNASAILIASEEGPVPIAALRSTNPYLDFARALDIFYQPPRYAPGIHPTAVISPSAKVGKGTHIGPYCFIDDEVVIGQNAVLHSFVTIYRGVRIGDDFFAHSHSCVREFCQLGNRVLLQNGVVIGSDGLGFAKRKDGAWYKIQQSGPAVIEDDVEIQANSTIDRATVGETRISKGAKLDNLVHVGHASKVGPDSLLCAQVGLAGTTRVGKGCILTGQVGAAGHLTIGDGAIITPQSGIAHDVPPGAFYSGSPVIDHKAWLKAVAVFSRLPELQKAVRELEAKITNLTSASSSSV